MMVPAPRLSLGMKMKVRSFEFEDAHGDRIKFVQPFPR
jgi:hypothetical protein